MTIISPHEEHVGDTDAPVARYDESIELLRSMINMRTVRLANCGNSAILAALYAVKKRNPKPFILIPDQGGWLTYETYPKVLNFAVKTVKTDSGVIDLEDLRLHAKTGAALLYSALAGYFAAQLLEEIYKLCQEAGCLVILDVSGTLGSPTLCRGEYADIMVGSFGKWKTADVGHGGFFSAHEREMIDDNELCGMLKHQIDPNVLHAKLALAPSRFLYLAAVCRDVKDGLSGADIIHPDSIGLVVAVRFKNDEEKKRIVDYCSAHEYEYTVCPRYIRVMEDAIAIEVKRRSGAGR